MNSLPLTLSSPIHCEIFCRVIDNYGDAAVCWRLARQLANEHDWRVCLWVDDLAPLIQLAPDYASTDVAVRHWAEENALNSDVVIEGFGCELPARKMTAMAAQPRKPVWINLDYLSAENWVGGCHGLNSPHPQLPLVKQFFFPGFDAQTGGLLRERDYAQRQQAFDPAAFRDEFKIPSPTANELTISVFSYPNPALPQLLKAWADSERPIRLLLPGKDQRHETRGNLHITPLPFLPQVRYDELLWASDLNFVRGEDSFVRAQWAAKPWVWNIYPQKDATHLIKLDAFLARYCNHPGDDQTQGLTVRITRDFWHAWNGSGTLDWPAFSATLPQQMAMAANWNSGLVKQPDLATKLVLFCLERIK